MFVSAAGGEGAAALEFLGEFRGAFGGAATVAGEEGFRGAVVFFPVAEFGCEGFGGDAGGVGAGDFVLWVEFVVGEAAQFAGEGGDGLGLGGAFQVDGALQGEELAVQLQGVGAEVWFGCGQGHG